MPEAKSMAEEANRMGREVQEQAQRVGREFQNAAGQGFDAASRSLSEVNRGFQALAAEITTMNETLDYRYPGESHVS